MAVSARARAPGVELAANCRGVTSERGTALMLLTAGTGLALRSVSHGFLAGALTPAVARDARARDASRARSCRARPIHTGRCMTLSVSWLLRCPVCSWGRVHGTAWMLLRVAARPVQTCGVPTSRDGACAGLAAAALLAMADGAPLWVARAAGACAALRARAFRGARARGPAFPGPRPGVHPGPGALHVDPLGACAAGYEALPGDDNCTVRGGVFFRRAGAAGGAGAAAHALWPAPAVHMPVVTPAAAAAAAAAAARDARAEEGEPFFHPSLAALRVPRRAERQAAHAPGADAAPVGSPTYPASFFASMHASVPQRDGLRWAEAAAAAPAWRAPAGGQGPSEPAFLPGPARPGPAAREHGAGQGPGEVAFHPSLARSASASWRRSEAQGTMVRCQAGAAR